MSMRRKIVAANWKMNLDKEEAFSLVKNIKKGAASIKPGVETVLFTNAVFLSDAAEFFKKSTKIKIGAQNCHYENKGAYTGEISVGMIKSAGAKFVLCGHSERRILFGETDETVAKKVLAVLENGLQVIICVGEELNIRKQKKHFEKVSAQLEAALGGIDKKYISKITIAYEPVWAIGTGVTATAAQAQEMHAFIRKELAKLLGPSAKNTSILYGGSCNENNAKELFACKDVDGGLIGGASLKADSFLKIASSF